MESLQEVFTWSHPPFDFSSDPRRLDLGVIHGFLSTSYWAAGVSRSIVERAIEHSLSFGGYCDGEQVAFARVVSDRATFAYLADVFVLERVRGRGVGKALVRGVRAHPSLRGLRRWLLATADAHGLYSQLGFSALANCQRFMEAFDPECYQRSSI